MGKPLDGRVERRGPDGGGILTAEENSVMAVESIPTRPGDLRLPLAVIGATSAGIFFFLVWILYFKENGEIAGSDLEFMPALNAALNAGSTAFLISGYIAIRNRKVKVHIACMISALILSACFLVSYLIYHNLHGDTPYPGQGVSRYVYFGVLISHIAMTTVALPLIITTFFLAFTRRFDIHRRVAKVAFPVWLYVSITGVVIFFLLRAALNA